LNSNQQSLTCRFCGGFVVQLLHYPTSQNIMGIEDIKTTPSTEEVKNRMTALRDRIKAL
jgi:hypothetical protein